MFDNYNSMIVNSVIVNYHQQAHSYSTSLSYFQTQIIHEIS